MGIAEFWRRQFLHSSCSSAPSNNRFLKVVRKIQGGKALFDKYEAKEAVQCERKNLQKILENYVLICHQIGEVMQDPVVAADGYTYEAEAMKGWLEIRHDTSPMTNLRLPYHQVVPNHSLRSAIQEWLDIPT
ncbi:hypothetical protein LWI28_008528 [Acer negundo]|uniref:U-box domain-containing protein n=1 Tax=Acer negundo TaxID=4023 RepID=A0AAD5IYG0_ACENE|nr:hypothetical protein LWI28_008528 [Acer negundo]KAK4848996.1 hypothetical protein QYF36_019569 [Acer negundo]